MKFRHKIGDTSNNNCSENNPAKYLLSPRCLPARSRSGEGRGEDRGEGGGHALDIHPHPRPPPSRGRGQMESIFIFHE